MRLSLARPAAAALVLLALSASAALAIPLKNFVLKANFNDYPPQAGAQFGSGYASCWSYIHGDGREYAVIGCREGTAIYNVTNPDACYFVGFITGVSSSWREMKSYRNWIYVVSEGFDGQNPLSPLTGVQIIRMTDPEHPVLAGSYTGTFGSSHTVSVDTTRAILICNGTRQTYAQDINRPATGMRILSLANPEAPVEIGSWPGGVAVPDSQYVHDCVPIGNKLYASSIYYGIERVFDFSNPSAPVQLAKWTYPGAFSHNSWPDASGNVLYVTDERGGEPLKVFDISNLSAPVLENTYTPNPVAIVHNAHVLGNELYIANYTEGIRVLDISAPGYPTEFGYADTYLGASGGFSGVWGICPYFPSGTVIASDMQTGLWVFRPVRNYGILHVRVRNAANHLALSGVKVDVTTEGLSLVTDSQGNVRFAPAPGTHHVAVNDYRYTPRSEDVVLQQGDRDTVVLDVDVKPTVTLSGVVRSSVNNAPLEDAEIEIDNTPLHGHTNAAGQYQFTLPEGGYVMHVRRPGAIPRVISRAYSVNNTVLYQEDFSLTPTAFYDNFEAASGWVVGGTPSETFIGAWVRDNPTGTSIGAAGTGNAASLAPDTRLASAPERPSERLLHQGEEGESAPVGPVQPEDDRTPPPGAQCFFTGQATSPGQEPNQSDVDAGRTTLTSPTLNATGMVNPTIGYWDWFFGERPDDDWLAVLISNNNGATWVSVDSLRGIHTHWEEEAIRISDYVTPTNQMKIRFEAADMGIGSLVEAAVDDITIYDQGNQSLGLQDPTPHVARMAFRAPHPNPSSAMVRLVLELPAATIVDVELLDVTGRHVRTLHNGRAAAGDLSLRWDGRDADGHAAPAGLYFARARAGGNEAEARIIRVQ